MSEAIDAEQIWVRNCLPECPCQSIWVVMADEGGTAIASISLDPEAARRMAADLLEAADIAQAARARVEGRQN